MDGLRGWAAISVMLFHIFSETFGNIEPAFRSPLVSPFLNGVLAVAVFFVLSGDALSASYWGRQSRRSVVRLAVKRYFRLTLPIFVSCLIVFLLMKFGLIFSHQAAQVVNREDWLGAFLDFDPSLRELVRYAGFDVFFNHTASKSFNPMLWTMSLELLGSVVVFLYLLLEVEIRLKFSFLWFVFFVCLCGHSLIACFVFGMICGRLRACGGFDWLRSQRAAQALAIFVVFIAVFGADLDHRLHLGFGLNIIAACLLVFGVYASRPLGSFFSCRLSRWLGRVSFPLYLVHFPVIASFTSGLVVLTHAHGTFGPTAIWLIALGSVALSLLGAVLFLPVETLTARIGDLACRAAMCGDPTIARGALPPAMAWNRRLPTLIGE